LIQVKPASQKLFPLPHLPPIGVGLVQTLVVCLAFIWFIKNWFGKEKEKAQTAKAATNNKVLEFILQLKKNKMKN